jgi:hypothetical protein
MASTGSPAGALASAVAPAPSLARRFGPLENSVLQLLNRRLNSTESPLIDPPLAINDQRRENA